MEIIQKICGKIFKHKYQHKYDIWKKKRYSVCRICGDRIGYVTLEIKHNREPFIASGQIAAKSVEFNGEILELFQGK